MKVLLDECIDTRLAHHLHAFEVRTVHDQGWTAITNGRLLALAQAEFDVFVTVDRNLSFQQNLPKFSIAVILIHARTNRLMDLVGKVPELLAAIPEARAGSVTHVGI
ncbi:MAG: DUF5615 family PIN-like protein [Vicinamibacteria bacterium]